jgi:ribonuclease HII
MSDAKQQTMLRRARRGRPPKIRPLLTFESELWRAGAIRVAGVDEVGRGPLAGPLLAAAVVLPKGVEVGPIRDSKCLTARQRERAFAFVHEHAVVWSIGRVDVDEIDRLNVARATQLAMRRAIEQLQVAPDWVLVDGNRPIPRPGLQQRCIVRGDQRCATIAAASVVAKVARDRLMLAYHEEFPDYGFDAHKGYGTQQHLAALRRLGPCPIHRRSFAPVREHMEGRLPLDE